MFNDIQSVFSEYNEFLEIPGITIENTGLNESVEWLKMKFEEMNASEIKLSNEFGSAPVIIGKFSGNSSKTLLIYNHYDVQPVGNIDDWDSEPFIPTFRENKIFARGISDCKGEIIARLISIDYLQRNGGLPCNVIFLVEGEEEIGSPNLAKYLNKYKDEIQADVCLWECGWKNEDEQEEICCGVKGILSFDLEIKTAKQPIHSSYANLLPNAAVRLSNALSKLIDAEGKVIIPNFYSSIDTDEMTKETLSKLSVNYTQMKNNFGVSDKWQVSDIVNKLFNEPTFNISQIQAGQLDSLNSIPNKASAKVDCRFLPSQDPMELLKLIRFTLNENGFSDVEVVHSHYEDAYRSDLNSHYIQSLVDCASHIYGFKNVKLVPNFAGGGPMSLLGNLLDIPIVSIGVSYSRSNVHSPNENIRLKDLEQNIECLIEWFSSI